MMVAPSLPPDDEVGPNERWTKALVLSNVGAVIGTSFMSGFYFMAISRTSIFLPPLNSTDDGCYGYGSRISLNNMAAIYYGAKIISFGGVASIIANQFGRKRALLLGAGVGLTAVIFTLVAAYLPWNDIAMLLMTVSCAMLALQNGAGQVVAPTFLVETAPLKLRGACGTFYDAFFWAGIVAASVISGANSPYTWQISLATSFVIYLLHFVLMWLSTESPLWLANDKQEDEAISALLKLRRCRFAEATSEFEGIKKLLANEQVAKSKGCCTTWCVWPLFLGVTLISANYLTGAPVMYQIQLAAALKSTESDVTHYWNFPFFLFVALTVCYIGFIVYSGVFVDQFGRRPLILASIAIMAFCYFPIALGTYNDMPFLWNIGSACFMAAYFLGPGPVTTYMAAELFRHPTRLSALNLCHLITQFIPIAVINVSDASQQGFRWFFLPFCAVVCLLDLVILYLFLPETMNVPLERISSEFFQPGKSRIQALTIPFYKRKQHETTSAAMEPSTDGSIVGATPGIKIISPSKDAIV